MPSNVIYNLKQKNSYPSRLNFSFVQNGFSDGVHTVTVSRAMLEYAKLNKTINLHVAVQPKRKSQLSIFISLFPSI